MDVLSKLAFKYETDKCPQIKHPFTPYYYELLKGKRKTIKKVLEIGIGYSEEGLRWRSYRTGASLFMWRDFFPNAQIYGADNDPKTIITDTRIKTYLCDQSNKEDLFNLIKEIGEDIDLIIDDGSHVRWHQVFTCQTLMSVIQKNVVYIIEDALYPRAIAKALPQYNCYIPNLKAKFSDDRLVVVTNKEVVKDLAKIRLIKKNYIWEEFMKKYDCKNVCEIGVCKGDNFMNFIKHKPEVAIAVDSWIDDGAVSRNDGGYSQDVLNEQYEGFVKRVAGKAFVKIYREYSYEAVKYFKDNYFDVIYIDADHSYEGCLKDLNDWYPKVKKGKFLVGDDYRIYEGRRRGVKFGVIEAVNEFTKKNNLTFYLLPNYGWAIIKP